MLVAGSGHARPDGTGTRMGWRRGRFRMRAAGNRQSGVAIIRTLVLLAFCALLAAGAWFYRDYTRFVATPLSAPADAPIDVARGMRFKDIVRQLRRSDAPDA